MASPKLEEFTTVDTSKGHLHGFVESSKKLVDGYVSIAGVVDNNFIPIFCNDQGNVIKVFSHSIRAFLNAVGLKYSADDPTFSHDKKATHITRVKTTNIDLLKYEDISENVVVLYTTIASKGSVVPTDVHCNNLDDVNKVFSQGARAFLEWEHLVYAADEPVIP